jgi:hypothetical protein
MTVTEKVRLNRFPRLAKRWEIQEGGQWYMRKIAYAELVRQREEAGA